MKAASFASSTRSSSSSLPSKSTSSSASLPRTQSFLAYYTSTTPDSPHKRARLKTILVLSLSGLYDPDAVRRRLDEAGEKERGVLVFERALLEGKVSGVWSFLFLNHKPTFAFSFFLAHVSITSPHSHIHRHKITAQRSSYSYTNYKTQYRQRRTVHLEVRWYQNGR